jgi:hypothetical protein
MKRLVAPLLALAATTLFPRPARAWLFHEHADIARAAFATLEPDDRRALEELWLEARGDAPGNLCTRVDAGGAAALRAGAAAPSDVCVDMPALTALAGDHACSANELARTARSAPWVLDVQRVANQTAHDLATAGDEARRRDVWGLSHLRMERVDDDYRTRASANRSHFLLPRRTLSLSAYARESVAPASEPNALGLYTVLHLSALRLAREVHDAPPSATRTALAARAVAAESFALHFLSDVFAAGHAVGSWGDGATRKGTHDYYSEEGLEARTWGGDVYSAHGDAHLTPVDVAHGARAVAQSLHELSLAYRDDALMAELTSLAPRDMDLVAQHDVCARTRMPYVIVPTTTLDALVPVFDQTIMPGQGADYVHLPRFRAEMGWFVGAYSGVRLGGALGGFETSLSALRFQGALEVGLRIGLGLDAVTGSVGDGLMFLQAGALSAGAQFDGPCATCPPDHRTNQLSPRVPSRSALSMRMRMPYWAVPGDLLLAAPVLGLVSFRTLKAIAMKAGDGGALGLERLLITDVGTVQLLLGREVGLTLFGFVGGDDPYQSLDPASGAYRTVALKTMEIDVPIVEYRPVRAFDRRTALGLLVQSGLTFDLPTSARFVSGEGSLALTPSLLAYLRFAFDGRLYL